MTTICAISGIGLVAQRTRRLPLHANQVGILALLQLLRIVLTTVLIVVVVVVNRLTATSLFQRTKLAIEMFEKSILVVVVVVCTIGW